MLRYPDASPVRPASERLDLQRQTNQALEERLAQLKQAARNVCLAPSQPKLLPPSPEKTNVPVPPLPGQSQPGSATIADLIDKATVLIVNDNSIGSGFFISERNIVTNHHVVGDATQVKVGSRALGGFVDARVIAVGAGRSNGTQDIAVLEVESNPGAPALRICVTHQRLRPVMAAGFPGAVLSTIDPRRTDQLPEANISSGMVTSRQVQQPGGVGAIIHTAQIGHGNSGGPLVDEGACAVGVNSWLSLDADRGRSYQTYNESLDAEELRKFLDSHNISYVKSDSECAPLAPPKPETPAPRAGGN
jgi:S1-C subfamily serine protease